MLIEIRHKGTKAQRHKVKKQKDKEKINPVPVRTEGALSYDI